MYKKDVNIIFDVQVCFLMPLFVLLFVLPSTTRFGFPIRIEYLPTYLPTMEAWSADAQDID